MNDTSAWIQIIQSMKVCISKKNNLNKCLVDNNKHRREIMYVFKETLYHNIMCGKFHWYRKHPHGPKGDCWWTFMFTNLWRSRCTPIQCVSLSETCIWFPWRNISKDISNDIHRIDIYEYHLPKWNIDQYERQSQWLQNKDHMRKQYDQGRERKELIILSSL